MSKTIDGVIYLTVDEAVNYTGVSYQTLYRWSKAKRIQRYKYMGDRQVYYKQSELDQAKAIKPVENKNE